MHGGGRVETLNHSHFISRTRHLLVALTCFSWLSLASRHPLATPIPRLSRCDNLISARITGPRLYLSMTLLWLYAHDHSAVLIDSSSSSYTSTRCIVTSSESSSSDIRRICISHTCCDRDGSMLLRLPRAQLHSSSSDMRRMLAQKEAAGGVCIM